MGEMLEVRSLDSLQKMPNTSPLQYAPQVAEDFRKEMGNSSLALGAFSEGTSSLLGVHPLSFSPPSFSSSLHGEG